MKAVVAAFNQEKPSRGLLRDYEPSDGTFSSTTSYSALSGEAGLCRDVSLDSGQQSLAWHAANGPWPQLEMPPKTRNLALYGQII